MTAFDTFTENIQKFAETGLNVVCNFVFGDLTGEAFLFLRVIVYNLLNGPVDFTSE